MIDAVALEVLARDAAVAKKAGVCYADWLRRTPMRMEYAEAMREVWGDLPAPFAKITVPSE